MEWKEWIGKNVFIRTTHERVYSGVIRDVDCDHLPIIWIVLIDKFGKIIQFSAEEIVQIKEEDVK